jgi:hypothetical protein
VQIYKEVSNWYYLALFLGTVAMALATIYTAKSGLPWWALFVALFFSWIFVPVIGTVRPLWGIL